MAPLATYSDKDLGVTFKYPANQASTFLVSKRDTLVHALLRDECGGRNVHMKLTIERTNELYTDIYDKKFNEMMVSEIIQQEAPEDLTEEQFLAIKECVRSEVVTLQGPGAFKAWHMTVLSDTNGALASFAMIIPVENNRSYRITCYPPDDDGSSVAIKEQQVIADLSANKKETAESSQTANQDAAESKKSEAPAPAAAAAAQDAAAAPVAPALTDVERRKEKKDRKKRQQAEERLFKEARAIIDSMVFLPEYTKLESESAWNIESCVAVGVKMLLPGSMYTLQRTNTQEASSDTFVASSNGNTPARKAQVKVSFLNCSSTQRYKELIQQDQDKTKANGQQTSSVSINNNAQGGVTDAFAFDSQFEQDGKMLNEHHLVAFALFKSSKLVRIEFSDGLQLRSKAQFIELCQRCIASVRLSSVSARAESSQYITYKNSSVGFEMDVRQIGAELHESGLSPVNVIIDDETTKGRIETSMSFFSLPQTLLQRAQQTGKPMSSKELLDILKLNLAQRIADIQTFHIVEEDESTVMAAGFAMPTCNLYLRRFQTIHTPDYKHQYDLYVIVNIYCTSTLIRNAAGEWRICNLLTARMDNLDKKSIEDMNGDWFPATVKDMHKSIRFFEPKMKIPLQPVILPMAPRQVAETAPAVEGEAKQAANGQNTEETTPEVPSTGKTE